MNPRKVQFFRIEPADVRPVPRFEFRYDIESIELIYDDDPKPPAERESEAAWLARVTDLDAELHTKGRFWPDFLQPDNGATPMLASQRVVNFIRREGLKGIRDTPVNFRSRGRMRFVKPPFPYYLLVPTGRAVPFRKRIIKYDVGDETCEEITDLPPNHPLVIKWREKSYDIIKDFIVSEWDGADLTPFSEEKVFGIFGAMYCSRAFIELAYLEKWTNLFALPIDSMGIENGTVELHDMIWPPETWYSEMQLKHWR